MKHFFVLFFLMSFFASCSVKVVPLKGHYPETPIVYTSTHNEAEVWDKLVDFFAQSGYSIKIIDKSSGLIVAHKTLLSSSFENQKGEIMHRHAYVILRHTKSSEEYPNQLRFQPEVRGDWNVRIKTVDNKTLININLVNLERKSPVAGERYDQWIDADGRTTGVFENELNVILQ